MARMNVGAATAAHRAHQAGASCPGSLAAHRLTFTSLTVRSRGQKQQAVFSLRASRYGAPYLGVRLFGATRKHNARP